MIDVGEVRENDDSALIVEDVVDQGHNSDLVEDVSRSQSPSTVLTNGKAPFEIDKESRADDRTAFFEKREEYYPDCSLENMELSASMASGLYP